VIWVAVVAGLYVVALLAVAWFSTRPPRIPIYFSPSALGLPQEEIETATSDGVTLRGWWVGTENPKTVAVFMHGYLMNRCEMLPEAFWLHGVGVSSLLIDERVHGKSGGKCTTMGVREIYDVEAAVAYARQREPGAKIVLVGSSMGSAASAMAAARNPGLADALILDSAYSRLSGAILGWWRFLGGPILSAVLSPTPIFAIAVTGVNPFSVDVSKSLRQLKVPVLFLHGSKDNLALPAEARRNFEAANEPKSIIWFEGCGHSEGRWLHHDRYREEVTSFLTHNGLL
jgi:pimeloyl-ACP methyl ester carboxylesterase